MLAGTVAAAAATRFLEGMLYGVEPGDPVTFVASPALFLLVAGAACALPAFRASRVPPTEALRDE